MISNRFRSLVIGVCLTLLLPAVAAAQAAGTVAQDVKVAVLPFTINAGDDLSYLQDSFPELMADRLQEAGFDVVPPADITKMMAEKGIVSINTQSARELAVLTGAGFSVHGTLNQIGDDLNLDARLIDAYGSGPGKKLSVKKEGLINLLPAVDVMVDRMKMDLLRQDVIAEVDVEGTQVLDKDVVLMRLTLQQGDMLTAASVNTALKNIYDLGYFDNVEVKVSDIPDGKKVVFAVEEKPRIEALGVRGSDDIDSEDILEAISTKKGGIVNPKVLADDIRVIREMYRKDGYYKAKVTHEMENAGNGLARLTFVIVEGPKLYIENVNIDGAEQMDPDDVKDVLALSERGMFSWISDTGVLKEELLERDAAAIGAFYKSKGFINVKVGKPQVDINDDGIDITYQVWEGDRFKMGETYFKGDLIDEPAVLKNVTAIDDLTVEDGYFDQSLLKSDVQKITTHYNNYGYAYADVKVNLKDDAETKIVDVVYTVDKHQRVHIRRVLVEGNTVSRDNVILREMRLADGDMFSGEKLQRSTQRLNNLGYFEKVDISPVQTGNPEEMDLVVKVKDKPTGSVSGGVGYSTYDGVFFAGNIAERNLFGKGYYLGLGGSYGSKNQSLSLNFKNPHINDSDLGFGVEVHHKNQDFNVYLKKSTGSTLNFFYPVGEYTNVSWGYTAEYYQLTDIDEDASDSVKEDAGSNVLSQLEASISRDTRDSFQYTTEGTVAGLSIAYGGGALGGTDNFVKYTGQFEWYVPTVEKVVFHSKFWGGFVHRNFGGDEIPTTQRFKLGGISSVRGYSSYRITPLDAEGEEEGGTKAFYMNLELRRVLSKKYGIGSLVFFDAGNSWNEDETIFSSPVREGSSPTLGLYKSVGVGVNWYSPMGPVGFVYGYGLDQIGSTGRHKIELLLGQQF